MKYFILSEILQRQVNLNQGFLNILLNVWCQNLLNIEPPENKTIKRPQTFMHAGSCT